MNQSDAFRANRDRYKAAMWRGKRRSDARRALQAAETPYSDEELIRQAEAEGKVQRLPPATADGASLASNRRDWK